MTPARIVVVGAGRVGPSVLKPLQTVAPVVVLLGDKVKRAGQCDKTDETLTRTLSRERIADARSDCSLKGVDDVLSK